MALRRNGELAEHDRRTNDIFEDADTDEVRLLRPKYQQQETLGRQQDTEAEHKRNFDRIYSSPGAWHRPTKAPNRVILEACHESFMKLPI